MPITDQFITFSSISSRSFARKQDFLRRESSLENERNLLTTELHYSDIIDFYTGFKHEYQQNFGTFSRFFPDSSQIQAS